MSKKVKKILPDYPVAYYVILGIIFLITSGYFWYSTWCGILTTRDSLEYIRMASGGITSGPDFYFWPPLFSSMINLLHFNIGIGFRGMQYFFMTTEFILIFFIGNNSIKNMYINLIWILVTVAGVSFQMIHAFLWSESLFLLIFLCMALCYDRYLKKRELFLFIVIIILSNLLCLQRNAGEFIVIGLTLIFAWYIPGRKRWLISIFYFITGSASFIIWNIFIAHVFQRNLMQIDASCLSFFPGNIIKYADIISLWAVPGIFNLYFRLAVLLIVVIILNYHRPHGHLYNDIAGTVYFLFIIYLAGMSSLGKIDRYEAERYLSIISPFALLVILKTISMYINRVKISTRILASIILFVWVAYSVGRTTINAARWHIESCPANMPK